MCDPPLVFAILETLTLLGKACENEFTDEVCRVYVNTIHFVHRTGHDDYIV